MKDHLVHIGKEIDKLLDTTNWHEENENQLGILNSMKKLNDEANSIISSNVFQDLRDAQSDFFDFHSGLTE